MNHLFIKGADEEKTLVLFHGTGGNEKDLVSIARIIDAESNILSIRGNVTENGMNRFFRRIEEGIFDEDDIRFRAEEIRNFLESASIKYGFSLKTLTGIGYSNGANIIAAVHYIYGNLFQKSILFHPMVPLKKAPGAKLNEKRIFIGAGENDPTVPFDNTMDLEKKLKDMGAEVSVYKYMRGHTLTADEVRDAAAWYNQ